MVLTRIVPRLFLTVAVAIGMVASIASRPDARAAAGTSLSIFTQECPEPLALDGTPITSEACPATEDRTFDLTGPDGQEAELVSELLFGDVEPGVRVARWSADPQDDLEDSGDYLLTEPAWEPDTPTLYDCLKAIRGDLVPAELSYVDGGVEFPWTPAVFTGDDMEGEALTCSAIRRPINPDLPIAGIIRIHAGVAALEDESDLIVRTAGDEPYNLRDGVGAYIPELTYSLTDDAGNVITLTAPETDQGVAVTSFPVPPANYTLSVDATGTTADITVEAGQTVLAFNPLRETIAPPPDGGDDYAPTPSPDDEPQIDAVDVFAYAVDDWVGTYEAIDSDVYRRDCVAVYGVDSPNPSGVLSFTLDTLTIGSSELVLTGLDDEVAGGNPIVITVNGEIIFDDVSPFYDWDPDDPEVHWNRLVIPFPNGVLVQGENEIVVTNVSAGGEIGAPPYILLSEAWVFVGISGVG